MRAAKHQWSKVANELSVNEVAKLCGIKYPIPAYAFPKDDTQLCFRGSPTYEKVLVLWRKHLPKGSEVVITVEGCYNVHKAGDSELRLWWSK